MFGILYLITITDTNTDTNTYTNTDIDTGTNKPKIQIKFSTSGKHFPQLHVSRRVWDSLLNYDQAPPLSHANVILNIQLLFVFIQT